MPALSGATMLLKIKREGVGYALLGGLRTKELRFNQTLIDVSAPTRVPAWRELLSSAAVRSVTLSGTGVFLQNEADTILQQLLLEGRAKRFQLVIPNVFMLTGNFLIEELAYAGEYDSEVSWEIALSSAGKITLATT